MGKEKGNSDIPAEVLALAALAAAESGGGGGGGAKEVYVQEDTPPSEAIRGAIWIKPSESEFERLEDEFF